MQCKREGVWEGPEGGGKLYEAVAWSPSTPAYAALALLFSMPLASWGVPCGQLTEENILGLIHQGSAQDSGNIEMWTVPRLQPPSRHREWSKGVLPVSPAGFLLHM